MSGWVQKLKGWFKPQDQVFFDSFRDSADLLVRAAQEFKNLVHNPHDAPARAQTISGLEHRCDEVTHRTLDLLHRTFITPIDRYEIHRLTSRLDDILDFIEAASERVVLFGIAEFPPEAIELADVCVRATEEVQKGIDSLSDLRDSDLILKCCVEINRLENLGDQILRKGLARLFKEEADTRQLIKLKEVLELLETVSDRCEDVANVLEGIVLEYGEHGV